MSKVAIVGVEGSGKTTLMAAFGEKYMVPDAKGISLEPKDEETMVAVGVTIAAMRDGRWPSATGASTTQELRWTVLLSDGGDVRAVGEIAFLDYAGEIYRLTFGRHSEDEKAPFRRQIEALNAHIQTADALVVLVDLAEVIDGDRTNRRLWEMIFQTGNIIQSAIDRGVSVAIAFSQADKYEQIMEADGGLASAYVKYLPLVATRHPKLPLFAVAAVDKTVVDSEGREIPACDFSSRGLDELMAWIAGDGSAGAGTSSEPADDAGKSSTTGVVSAEDVHAAISGVAPNKRLLCGESLLWGVQESIRRQMGIGDGDDEVLMMYDTSCFCSRASGLVLTSRRICLKESWKETKCFAWNEVSQVDAEKDRPGISVNGHSIVLSECSVAQCSLLVEGIRRLVGKSRTTFNVI